MILVKQDPTNYGVFFLPKKLEDWQVRHVNYKESTYSLWSKESKCYGARALTYQNDYLYVGG